MSLYNLMCYRLTCTKGWSGLRKTPGFFSRADLEPVCPVTGCVDTWRAVATDCSKVSSPTWGPTARSARGNSIALNSNPSKSHARRPSNLFSQNSCKESNFLQNLSSQHCVCAFVTPPVLVFVTFLTEVRECTSGVGGLTWQDSIYSRWWTNKMVCKNFSLCIIAYDWSQLNRKTYQNYKLTRQVI